MKAFPEIKLDLLIDYVVDNRGKNPAYYCDEGIPVIDNFQITGKRHINLKESKRFIDEKVYDEFLRKYLIENDLLLTLVGNGYGSVSLAPKQKSVIIQNTIGIRCNEKCLNEFLFYYFSKNKHKILELNRGAAQPSVKVSDVKGILVSLPPLTQQKTIVSILSNYDELIFNNEQRIKILEEMAQAIYTEWFVNFRFPGHENVKQVDSKTDFGEIPEGWEIMKVEDLLERIQSGKKYDNKTVVNHGVVPVLDQGKKGTIGYHNDEPGVVASKEQPIIVFANHTCYQNLIMYSFSTIQNVLPFLPTENRNIYWLHWATKDLIKFNDYKGHWPEFTSKKSLVPTAELTNKFGDLISPMVKLKYDLERQNKVLTETRDLLIPKLVTGEIEIKA